VLKDELPNRQYRHLIYCPGSINLKPIGSLSIDDFRNDFEINVIGAKNDSKISTSIKRN
jgi:hypothetical protein